MNAVTRSYGDAVSLARGVLSSKGTATVDELTGARRALLPHSLTLGATAKNAEVRDLLRRLADARHGAVRAGRTGRSAAPHATSPTMGDAA